MSFIRPGSKKKYSNSNNEGLYAFLGKTVEGDHYIEDYNAMRNPEDFCEIIFRVLNRSDVEVTLEMVNKVRDQLKLEPLDQLQEGGKTDEFLEGLLEE